MRLIYYSLAVTEGNGCERQWLQSIRSLRRHNRAIPVQLVAYGWPANATLEAADALNVHVVQAGAYPDCFRGLPAGPAMALARLPTLHKLLSLRHCPVEGVDQILFLDCDTYFFRDVGLLFDHHLTCHWYAREEPLSSRSAEGAHPAYLDEALLQRMAETEGLAAIPPYNTGIILLNGGVWHQLRALADAFLETCWRLAVGLCFRAPLGSDADPEFLRAVARHASEQDRRTCLAFPCRNSWLFDEIAAWLTLGRIPGLSHDELARQDVAQGDEFARRREPPVVAHYFGGMEDRFFATVPRL